MKPLSHDRRAGGSCARIRRAKPKKITPHLTKVGRAVIASGFCVQPELVVLISQCPEVGRNGQHLGRLKADKAIGLLAAIVDSSDDAIVSKTLDGIITSWNASAVRLFGYAASEAVGRHISLIIPVNRRDEEKVIIEKIKRGEGIKHSDTVPLCKFNKSVDLSLTISPIRDASGKIIGASENCR